MSEKVRPVDVVFPRDKDVTVAYLVSAYRAATVMERGLLREKVIGLPASKLKDLATKIYGSVALEEHGIAERESLYKLVVWYVMEVSNGLNDEQLSALRRHRSALIGTAQCVYEPTDQEKESDMETTNAKAVEKTESSVLSKKKKGTSSRTDNGTAAVKKTTKAKVAAAPKEKKEKTIHKYHLTKKVEDLVGFTRGPAQKIAHLFDAPITVDDAVAEVLKQHKDLFLFSKRDPKIHAAGRVAFILRNLKSQNAIKES